MRKLNMNVAATVLFAIAGAVAAGAALAAVPADEPVREVGFAPDSDEVDAAGAKVLDEVAARAKELGDVAVTISGHTDQVEGEDGGSPSYRIGLSHRRAANVRSGLAARGVKDGNMTAMAYGQASPGERQGDQQRRVEIRFGEGAGW